MKKKLTLASLAVGLIGGLTFAQLSGGPPKRTLRLNRYRGQPIAGLVRREASGIKRDPAQPLGGAPPGQLDQARPTTRVRVETPLCCL